MLKRVNRYLQPLGFALLLAYFLISQLPFGKIVFWLGMVLSLLGTLVEVLLFMRLTTTKKRQRKFNVVLGILIKLSLMLAIALRVYDVKYSVFFLLGIIVLAILWNVLNYFYKPDDNSENEILDAPGDQ